MPDQPIRNILIVRLSAIGDIVMASAIIEPLKKKYPHSNIYWLAQPECKALLEHHPDISGVISWPRAQWIQLWKDKHYGELWKTLRHFRKQLRQQSFDLALDLQGLLKSGILTYLSGATKRIGLGSREGSQYLMHQIISRQLGNTRMIGSEYRYLAEQLELDTADWQMQVAYDQQAAQQAEQLIAEHVAGQAFIIICPFTTRPQKHWFNDYWVELSEKLSNRYQCPILMLGGPGDTKATQVIVSQSTVIDLTGKTSLPAAMAVIERAQLLVGVDTGLTHMGHAAAIPTIALFGSTRPYLETGLRSSHVIYHPMECSPCKRNPTCDGRFDCLRSITPDEVMGVAQALLRDQSE
ncbi:MAG: glycosyltransferase family 9 protein [Thiolinea sp.]